MLGIIKTIFYFEIFLIIGVMRYSKSEWNIESNFLIEYDKKINQSLPSCDLVNHANLPYDRRTLVGRDCMCDIDCIDYKDCCKDSIFYDANEQTQPSKFQCSTYAGTYMINNCPEEWNNIEIRHLCEKSNKPIEDNVTIVLPYSNPYTRITYGNLFCAICNNESDINSLIEWDIGALCGKPTPGYLNDPSITTTKSPFIYFRNKKPAPINYKEFANQSNEIVKYAEYDYVNKEFVSKYNDSVFVCKLQAVLPSNFEYFVRICKPFMIDYCPNGVANQSVIGACKSYTSIVYNNITNKIYRNKDCAVCNDERLQSLTSHPFDTRNDIFGMVISIYETGAAGEFHVKPNHGFSSQSIAPESTGLAQKVKPGKLFKPLSSAGVYSKN